MDSKSISPLSQGVVWWGVELLAMRYLSNSYKIRWQRVFLEGAHPKNNQFNSTVEEFKLYYGLRTKLRLSSLIFAICLFIIYNKLSHEQARYLITRVP